MANDLRATVLEKDWGATLLAREAGPAGAGKIVDLVGHEDRDVRLLTVTCLGDMGGPEAGGALVKALLDEDLQIREVASRGLLQHPDPGLHASLLSAFDASQDAGVRAQIPRIMCAGEKMPDPAPLIERWKKETDDAVREGFVVGLSRCGIEDARTEFVKRLQASTGNGRDRMLEHAEYVSQPWLLKPLKPVLADTTPLRYVGPHGHDVNLRACDIAVRLVAKISGKAFSFPVTGPKNFTPPQLDEVRKYLDSLPK
jgi:hypothetical protein